jgi:hypothetical protein
MGGLISRWCLKDMEDRGLDHRVENYFSYDSPHQGANIPLGMQFIFNEMEDDMQYLRFERSFRALAEANKSPAAKQMMVTRALFSTQFFGTLHPLRDKFAERLVNKGYPQQTNNYGISFGRGDNPANTTESGNGELFGGFDPGDQIYEGNLSFVLVNLQSEGYAVPVNGNTQIITKYRFEGIATRKIFGLLPQLVPRIKFKNFKYTGQYPYDDAPGGFEETQADFAENLTGNNGFSGTPNTFGHDGHNFVSTVSGLDLQNQNYSASNDWQSDDLYFAIDDFIQNPGAVNGNTLSDPTLSPFQAVVTSTSDQAGGNIFHNAPIAQQFSQFILRNILNDPAFNCQDDSFCNAEPAIDGPGVICNNTATYTINDFPNDVAINWTSENNKVSVTDGQGTPTANFNINGTGAETIIATITSVCGASKTMKLEVWIGSTTITGNWYSYNNSPQYPLQPYYSVPNNEVAEVPAYVTASFSAPGASTSDVQFMDASDPSITWGMAGTEEILLNFDFYDYNQWVIFKVTASNSCGSDEYDVAFYSVEEEMQMYSMSPNPANDQLTTSPPLRSEIKPFEIKLFNSKGEAIHSAKSNGKSDITVNTRSIPEGAYILHIIEGEKIISKHVIIEH